MSTSFEAMTDVSSFRKTAASMWKAPNDPTIYGSMDVDASTALAFIEGHRERTGQRLTITHLVCAAVARAFVKYPHLNAKVRFGGRLERRRDVDLFVSVATGGGKDLSGARIDHADRLTLAQWIPAIAGKARAIREGTDPSFEKSRSLFKLLPFFLLSPLLKLVDWLTNELHLDLPKQGMPRDPFGAAVITNVGPFGIDTAFAPFIPLARAPMLLLISEVKDRPWVDGKQLVVRPVLRLCATFDHRIIDGFSAGKLAEVIREALEQPRLLVDATLPEELREAA
ncbi:MAG: 2-oxo acid dehydrogenase subunit E2 [Archangium sp.]